MNRRVRLTAEAERDISEASAWYREEAPHVDPLFREAIQRTLRLIHERPKLYPVIHRNVRRANLRGFPFSIIYRLLDEEIQAFAVFHQSRDPRVWQRRR